MQQPKGSGPDQSLRQGVMDSLQAKLGDLSFVQQVQAKLDGVSLAGFTPAAPGPGVASGADYIWTAVLAVASLLSIWFMKWWMWPVFLPVLALAVLYGMRAGAPLLTRGKFFLAAGAAGLFALWANESFGDMATFGGILLLAAAGRGIWALVKDGMVDTGAEPITGRRFQVLVAGIMLCFVSLAFQWESVSNSASVSWRLTGTRYVDSGGRTVRDNTYYTPEVNWRFYGGGNGSDAFLWVLGAGVLLLVYRNKRWPGWAKAVLTFCFVMMLANGLRGISDYLGIGIILFFGGFGAIGWVMFRRAGPVLTE